MFCTRHWCPYFCKISKTRPRGIGYWNALLTLIFCTRHGCSDFNTPSRFHSDWKTRNNNLALWYFAKCDGKMSYAIMNQLLSRRYHFSIAILSCICIRNRKAYPFVIFSYITLFIEANISVIIHQANSESRILLSIRCAVNLAIVNVSLVTTRIQGRQAVVKYCVRFNSSVRCATYG